MNLESLRAMVESRQYGSAFKLDKQGVVRIRVLPPIGKDMNPICIADSHYVPYIDDTGEERKKLIYCGNCFSDRCVVCELVELLKTVSPALMSNFIQTLKVNAKYGLYVIDRKYMFSQEEGSGDDDDEIVYKADPKEKPHLFTAPLTVGNAIIGLMEKKMWGDPSHPTKGYDLLITGRVKKGGFPNYEVQPVAKDASPGYDIDIIKVNKLRPLSQVIIPASLSDVFESLQPSLNAILEISSNDDPTLLEELKAWIKGVRIEIKRSPKPASAPTIGSSGGDKKQPSLLGGKKKPSHPAYEMEEEELELEEDDEEEEEKPTRGKKSSSSRPASAKSIRETMPDIEEEEEEDEEEEEEKKPTRGRKAQAKPKYKIEEEEEEEEEDEEEEEEKKPTRGKRSASKRRFSDDEEEEKENEDEEEEEEKPTVGRRSSKGKPVYEEDDEEEEAGDDEEEEGDDEEEEEEKPTRGKKSRSAASARETDVRSKSSGSKTPMSSMRQGKSRK